jgi:hypothetical protein
VLMSYPLPYSPLAGESLTSNRHAVNQYGGTFLRTHRTNHAPAFMDAQRRAHRGIAPPISCIARFEADWFKDATAGAPASKFRPGRSGAAGSVSPRLRWHRGNCPGLYKWSESCAGPLSRGPAGDVNRKPFRMHLGANCATRTWVGARKAPAEDARDAGLIIPDTIACIALSTERR